MNAQHDITNQTDWSLRESSMVMLCKVMLWKVMYAMLDDPHAANSANTHEKVIGPH